MNLVKFIRIFLLFLIVIGIGLLVTQKFWVPKVVNMILGPQMIQENTMNSENKTIEKAENQEIQSQRELYCKDEFTENATEGLPKEVKAIMDRINICSFLGGEVGGGDMDEVNKAMDESGCGKLEKDQSDLINKYSENQVVVNAIKSAIFWRLGEACYGDVIKVKLVQNSNSWLEVKDYFKGFKGKLLFESIDNSTQYPVTLCVKDWPNLKTNSYYYLNLSSYEYSTQHPLYVEGSELRECFTEDLNLLFITIK